MTFHEAAKKTEVSDFPRFLGKFRACVVGVYRALFPFLPPESLGTWDNHTIGYSSARFWAAVNQNIYGSPIHRSINEWALVSAKSKSNRDSLY